MERETYSDSADLFDDGDLPRPENLYNNVIVPMFRILGDSLRESLRDVYASLRENIHFKEIIVR